MAASSLNGTAQTNEPPDTALKQQRMKAWNPILDPVYVIASLIIIGVAFVPVGVKLLQISDDVVEMTKTYDSYYENKITSNLDCEIDQANQGKECTIEFTVEKDMEPPILVYYEIENFYQNHREYTTSRDDEQLLGADPSTQTQLNAKDCEPLNKIGDITINPCGLIANTFFNDVIKLSSGSTDIEGNALTLIEDGIAWQSDLDYKFAQPLSFKSEQCKSCDDDDCQCTGEWTCKEKYQDPETNECHLYSYSNDDTTQYLYETYPDIISPLEGVTNEHFVVWMRVAAKPKFRKMYGFFDQPIKAGTTLSFVVKNNWIVKSFKGTKSLVVTTTSMFGGKNPNFGQAFIGVGGICIIFGVFFGLKQIIKPRKLAEKKYLKYKED
jgi:hypothetical protein